MNYANENVAHQVSSAEQFKTLIYLEPEDEPPEILGASVVGVILLVPTDGIVMELSGLADALQGVLERNLQSGSDELVAQGRKIGIDKLYNAARKIDESI